MKNKQKIFSFVKRFVAFRRCIFVAAIVSVPMPVAFAQKPETELAQIKLAHVMPSQKGIDIDSLAENEFASSTLTLEEQKRYVLKNPSGKVIRVLLDTNNDKKLDQWCFFKNGIEVYRDIDTDNDQTADQMRWFNTLGTRWGVDTDKNSVIDYWKVISPEETTDEVVKAIVTHDLNCFLRVAINADDLKTLRCGEELNKKLADRIANYSKTFEASCQAIPTTPQTHWGQFNGFRPATIPANEPQNNADLTVYVNTTILIADGESGENGRQIITGSMVKVGDTWKVIDTPLPFSDDYISPFGDANSLQGSQGGQAAVSPKVQGLIQQILDLEAKVKEINDAEKEKRSPIYDEIIRLRIETAFEFEKTNPAERDQWLRDLADFMYTIVAVDNYSGGVDKMKRMSDQLKVSGNLEVAAYLQYRAIAAELYQAQVTGTGTSEAYTKWLGALEQLTKDFANTNTGANAQIDLINEYEMSGQPEKAKETAQSLVKTHPNTPYGNKAAGILRRLDSVGKEFPFDGKSVTGTTINVSQYKGKYVVLYFWTTWSDPNNTQADEMKRRIQSLYERDVAIIGINLDNNPDVMTQYITKNAIRWPQIHEPGGQESRPAVYAGVTNVPFFMILDKEGKVVQNGLVLPEDVDREIFRLIRQ